MGRSTAGMGPEGIARRRLSDAARALGGERLEALRAAGLTLVWTRLAVAVIAIATAAIAGTHAGNALSFDAPALTHPFGGAVNALFSPLARWDAVWYLEIARSGYGGPSTAFFPLYPLVVRALAPGGSPGALLVMSYVVSLAALAGALYLMHRLVALELGEQVARVAVPMLALFPGALWLGAPYSESLFLLLSVGAFYAARTGRWACAGTCAALASATRSAGVVLVVPLLVLWWQSGPRRRVRDLLWIALAPAGLVAYTVYLALELGDGFAYLHLQEVWFRSFAGPFGAVPDGAVAAWDGLRQLLSGSRSHVYFTAAGGDPFSVAWHNLELFGFLIFAVVAAVGVLRRLPRAYGAYTVAALALPLSFPVGPQPLMSLPRFLAVLFPLFMWLAVACRTPRRRGLAMAALALGLGVFTARYATWHWVA
jgi:Mannosyltransferase (PIG-V)